MKTKYILIGGTVRSVTDEDLHHITAQQLVRLYDLDIRECALYSEWPSQVERPDEYQHFRSLSGRCLILEPRDIGDYKEHRAGQEYLATTQNLWRTA